MRLKEYFFLKLAEECAEVTQRVAKLMEFGEDEVQAGEVYNNRERLQSEVNDVLAMICILQLMPDEATLADVTVVKQRKIEKYLKLSRERGCIDD